MKRCKYLLLCLCVLLVSCGQNIDKKEIVSIINSELTQTTQTNDGHQQATIPDFLASSLKFQEFIDDTTLNYEHKSKLIDDFFANHELYTEEQLVDIFSTIGSEISWEVDLISQFQYRMKQDVISKKPNILCGIADKLSNDQMRKFVIFYLGNVIWNNEFPPEFYTLKKCHSETFDLLVEIFYKKFLSDSKNKALKYIVNDPDGETNLRTRPSSKSSDIIHIIPNKQSVIVLWSEEDWFFVKSDNQLGYIYSKNLSRENHKPNFTSYKQLHNQWHGTYYYSNYEMGNDGVGYGAEYTINIDNNCNIDIIGFQVDKSFSCYIKKGNNNTLNIYDKNNKKFGVLRKADDKYYLKIYYYDREEKEVSVDFTQK